MKFNYDKHNPTRGGKFIPLPKWVSSKKACINIKNQDELCFKYSVQCRICKVYEKDHPKRVSHYKSLNDELNWDNVNFPSSYADIDTFEENNGGKVAVNVYFIDPEEGKQSILLHRQTKVQRATHQIRLLKLEDGDDYHYVFIKDYDKLIECQTNNAPIWLKRAPKSAMSWFSSCPHSQSRSLLISKKFFGSFPSRLARCLRVKANAFSTLCMPGLELVKRESIYMCSSRCTSAKQISSPECSFHLAYHRLCFVIPSNKFHSFFLSLDTTAAGRRILEICSIIFC